jgi:hypothetical protein
MVADPIGKHLGRPGPLERRLVQHRLPKGPQQRIQRRKTQNMQLSEPE